MIAHLLVAASLGSGFSPMIVGESGLMYRFSNDLDISAKAAVRYVDSLERIARETTKRARRFGPLTPKAAAIAVYGTSVYIVPEIFDCPVQSGERCTVDDGGKTCKTVFVPGRCRGAYYGARGMIKIAYDPCPGLSSFSHELIHRALHSWLNFMDYEHDNRGLYYGENSVPQDVYRVVGCE